MGLDMWMYGREKTRRDDYELAYWRKYWSLHKVFVDMVQNGKDDKKPHVVSKRRLTKILAMLKAGEIKENFAGDEQDAINQITEILETFDFEGARLWYKGGW